MGELSKNIGERGEEIIEYLFKELLGYPHYSKGISIECINGEVHSQKKGTLKTTHGIDGLIFGNSPIKDNCLEIGIISSKFTSKPYPSSNSKFKEHFKDIAWTIECFNNSEKRANIEKNVDTVDKTEIVGILFWLSNDEDSYDTDTMPIYSKSQFSPGELNFDKIIYVDNARLKFLIDFLEPIKNNFGFENYSFIYPDTGFNLIADKHKGFGDKFPLSFFYSDIIPLRLVQNKNVYLYVVCRKQFEKDDFSKIVGLIKTFNHLQATQKTIIAFPNYNKNSHQSEIEEKLAAFADEKFTNQIIVVKTTTDFRNLSL